MGIYRTEVNSVSHNFNNSTVLFNKEFNAEGLNMWAVILDEDSHSTTAVADGTACLNEFNVRTGTIEVEMLESHPACKELWKLYNDNKQIEIGFTDSASPELDCGGKYCKIQKPYDVGREKEVKIIKWIFVSTYLKVKGDSYNLVAETG